MRTPDTHRSQKGGTESESEDNTKDGPEAAGGTKTRRKTLFNLVASVRAINVATRLSQMMKKDGGLLETGKQEARPVKLENTYKMEPDEGCGYKPIEIKDRINTVLEQMFKDKRYDKEECAKLSLQTADKIKYLVCKLSMNRYKIVVHVTVGQKMSQCANTSSSVPLSHEPLFYIYSLKVYRLDI